MSYTTLMTYIDADDSPEQRVHLAANLADKFNATLIGLSALAVRPPLIAVGGVITEDVTKIDIGTISATLVNRGKWFRNIAGAAQRKLEWRAVIDFPAEALASEARSADLVIMGRTKTGGDLYRSLNPAVAILRTGRPVLAVPDGIGSLRAEHVVVGWKDTREARRAVQDALPFLHEAARVTIIEICGTAEEETARQHIDDVARYLERHRIKGTPEIIVHQNGSGAAQLIRHAQDVGADLIVTGAYGHSRLGEWIFGGMTRELLASSPVCCLMSH